jgi:transcriptional regulator with XRE-family HTH domain
LSNGKNVKCKHSEKLLKHQREKNGMLLRQVGAAIEIDQALVSKFERGERKPSREQVLLFAKLFSIEENELMIAWLSDKLANEVQNEDLAKEAIKAAEKKN